MLAKYSATMDKLHRTGEEEEEEEEEELDIEMQEPYHLLKVREGRRAEVKVGRGRCSTYVRMLCT